MSSSDTQTTKESPLPIEKDETEERLPQEDDAQNSDEELEDLEQETEESVREENEEQPIQAPDLYDSGKCNLHVTITMLRDDGDPQGRQVLLGARNDNDDPIITATRAHTLEELIGELSELYARLIADLPRRKASMQERLQATQKRQQEGTKQPTPTTAASTPTKEVAGTPSGEQAQTVSPPTPVEKPKIGAVKQGGRRNTKPDAERQTEQMTLF